ncbi:MAG: HAD family hydrolase [Acidimicrobiales bacterium]
MADGASNEDRGDGPDEGPPVRLVATDLDGTLLRPDGTVSERTANAVRAAREAGVHVVPITGRPPRVTWEVAKHAGLGPLGVCSNGAALVDLGSREVIELQTIAAEVCAGLVENLRRDFPGVVFAVEEMERLTHEPGFMDPSWAWSERTRQVGDIAQAVSSSCIKLIVRRPGWSAGGLLAALRQGFAEKGHMTSSGLDWVEIGAPGISKAYAAERVCDRLGIGVAEVLAVGDNHNDLTVLGWAGRAAAPANAIPEVLAAVQRVIPSNGEDGVAQLLEGLTASARPRLSPAGPRNALSALGLPSTRVLHGPRQGRPGVGQRGADSVALLQGQDALGDNFGPALGRPAHPEETAPCPTEDQ